jgi:hypothetical protein
VSAHSVIPGLSEMVRKVRKERPHVSRQRVFQIAHNRLGFCPFCSQPRQPHTTLCTSHESRERRQKERKLGRKIKVRGPQKYRRGRNPVFDKALAKAMKQHPGASRQYRKMVAKNSIGLCAACDQPLFTKTHCEKHALSLRKTCRKAAGCKSWRPGGRGRPPTEATRKAD